MLGGQKISLLLIILTCLYLCELPNPKILILYMLKCIPFIERHFSLVSLDHKIHYSVCGEPAGKTKTNEVSSRQLFDHP